MCMKTPKAPEAPAPAPLVDMTQRPMAPKLNASAKEDQTAKKRKGTKALRIDMAAPQGGSGLNI